MFMVEHKRWRPPKASVSFPVHFPAFPGFPSLCSFYTPLLTLRPRPFTPVWTSPAREKSPVGAPARSIPARRRAPR